MKTLAHMNPLKMMGSLHSHRDLIVQLAQRAFASRYKGSVLGMAWSFINPLAALVIYTIIFGYVFKSRWARSASESQVEFAITMFCGMIPFTFFSDLLNRSPMFIVCTPNYVKKIIFPLEVISVAEALSGLAHLLVSLTILIALCAAFLGRLNWTLVYLPLGMLPLVMLSLGFSWWLASAGVFLRDIGHTVALVMNMLFFLTPIFYDIESTGIPKAMRDLMRLNPLATIVDIFRRSILWGLSPDWLSFAYVLAVSFVVMMAGYAWFMKSKKAFSDVL